MDYAMKNDKWYPLRKGTLKTWVGDDQLTYRIVHQKPGWVVTWVVAGAGLLILDGPKKTVARSADPSRGGCESRPAAIDDPDL